MITPKTVSAPAPAPSLASDNAEAVRVVGQTNPGREHRLRGLRAGDSRSAMSSWRSSRRLSPARSRPACRFRRCSAPRRSVQPARRDRRSLRWCRRSRRAAARRSRNAMLPASSRTTASIFVPPRSMPMRMRLLARDLERHRAERVGRLDDDKAAPVQAPSGAPPICPELLDGRASARKSPSRSGRHVPACRRPCTTNRTGLAADATDPPAAQYRDAAVLRLCVGTSASSDWPFKLDSARRLRRARRRQMRPHRPRQSAAGLASGRCAARRAGGR